jgi:hypothetical protein
VKSALSPLHLLSFFRRKQEKCQHRCASSVILQKITEGIVSTCVSCVILQKKTEGSISTEVHLLCILQKKTEGSVSTDVHLLSFFRRKQKYVAA